MPDEPSQPQPQGTPTERDVLSGYLAGQRRRILTALDGLTDDQLTTAVLPSGWTPVQLVHHLTVDDEVFWFGAVVAADPEIVAAVGDVPGWRVPEALAPQDVLAGYRAAAARSDEILAAVALDAAPRWWPDFMGAHRMGTVREVVLHVIVETAAHAGQLDAVVELVDGRQWLVLD